MLNFDSTKKPMRPTEWVAVIDAVFNAAPGDEQTWLEWKSSLDLTAKDVIAATVAKAILGFANRDPDEAATTVGGIGILMIGVSPGSVDGVTPIDNAELDKALTVYIGGADGPAWQPHWYKYQSRDVLIIEVAAPQWGDYPHTMRKEFTAISNGQIFVRRRARTDPADSRDVRRLSDRYAAKSAQPLSVMVGFDLDEEISPISWKESDRDAYIEAERKRLMGSLDEHHRKQKVDEEERRLRRFGLVERSFTLNLSMAAETRTEQSFEQEVEFYLAGIASQWDEAVVHAAVHLLGDVKFWVRNSSERNYRELEVVLDVEGDAWAFRSDHDAPDDGIASYLPSSPRPFGPWFGHEYLGLGSAAQFSSPMDVPEVRIQNGGSFTLTFPPLNLRPAKTETLADDICLVVPARRTTPLVVSWKASATNVDVLTYGQFTIPVEGATLDVVEALKE